MGKQFNPLSTLAFDKHISELHNSDFEVCQNPICVLGVWLEDNLTLENSQDIQADENGTF